MAADEPTRRPGTSPSLGPWLIVALAVVTGYTAWQILPLSGRIDSLERQNLAIRDRMLAEIERLNAEVAVLRGAPVADEPAIAPAVAPPAAAPAAVASARPPTAPEAKHSPPVDPVAYVDAHLLPADAAIARAMLNGMPLQDIARDTQHSAAFVLARGAQLEKMLSAAVTARSFAASTNALVASHGVSYTCSATGVSPYPSGPP
jgi:hypothetical protein